MNTFRYNQKYPKNIYVKQLDIKIIQKFINFNRHNIHIYNILISHKYLITIYTIEFYKYKNLSQQIYNNLNIRNTKLTLN